ncbi:MAG: hypothetical protein HEQ23_04565 [Tepidisphaera sp.]
MSIPEPSPASKPAKPPVFGNSMAVLACLLLAVGLGVAANLIIGTQRQARSPELASAYSMGAMIGVVIGAILFPLLLGWIAYWLGLRSTKAARITACVVAVFVSMGHVSRVVVERQRARVASQKDFTDELNAARNEQARAIRSGDTDKIADASDRSLAVIEKMGEDTPELKAVATTMASLGRELNGLAIAQNEAFEKLGTLGGVDPATITSEADIEARLAQLQTTLDAAITYQKEFDGFETKAKDALRAASVSPQMVSSVMNGFRSNAKVRAKQAKLNASNVECCGTMKSMLTMLKKHWGEWEMQGDEVAFEEKVPDADIEAYNQAAVRLDEQIAEQDTLTSDIADSLAERAAAPKR